MRFPWPRHYWFHLSTPGFKLLSRILLRVRCVELHKVHAGERHSVHGRPAVNPSNSNIFAYEICYDIGWAVTWRCRTGGYFEKGFHLIVVFQTIREGSIVRVGDDIKSREVGCKQKGGGGVSLSSMNHAWGAHLHRSFWIPVYKTSKPENSSVQILEHIAAQLLELFNISRAAAAVDLVLIVIAVGSFSAKKSRHWPSAWYWINNIHTSCKRYPRPVHGS